MGYRDETEHLRAKVARLEAELRAIRGDRRPAKIVSDGARVRRQLLSLVGVALLTSVCAFTCAAPAAMIAYARRGVSVPTLAAGHVERYGDVHFRGSPDLRDVRLARGRSPYAPLVGEPRVLYYCDYDCPRSIETQMRLAASGHAHAGVERRGLSGRVRIARAGGYAPIPTPELERYAAEHGLDLTQIRVVRASDRWGAPVFLGFALLFGLWALAAWLMVLAHGRLARRPIPQPRHADLEPSEPALVLALSFLTFRAYELLWLYRLTARMRRLTGRSDLAPEVDLVMTALTLGLWPLWALYRNAEAADEALEALGVPSVHRHRHLGLAIASVAFWPLIWGMVYQAQAAANALVRALDAPERRERATGPGLPPRPVAASPQPPATEVRDG